MKACRKETQVHVCNTIQSNTQSPTARPRKTRSSFYITYIMYVIYLYIIAAVHVYIYNRFGGHHAVIGLERDTYITLLLFIISLHNV